RRRPSLQTTEKTPYPTKVAAVHSRHPLCLSIDLEKNRRTRAGVTSKCNGEDATLMRHPLSSEECQLPESAVRRCESFRPREMRRGVIQNRQSVLIVAHDARDSAAVDQLARIARSH